MSMALGGNGRYIVAIIAGDHKEVCSPRTSVQAFMKREKRFWDNKASTESFKMSCRVRDVSPFCRYNQVSLVVYRSISFVLLRKSLDFVGISVPFHFFENNPQCQKYFQQHKFQGKQSCSFLGGYLKILLTSMCMDSPLYPVKQPKILRDYARFFPAMFVCSKRFKNVPLRSNSENSKNSTSLGFSDAFKIQVL